MRILFLLTISLFLFSCNAGDGNSATDKKNVKNTTTSPHPSQGKTSEEKDALSKKKMGRYSDDVFVNRAVRSADLYCKCKKQPTTEQIESCQKLAAKTHETRMKKFPEDKAAIYDKTYLEETKKCQ